ncbi:hypothetical protein ACFWPU_07015 [Streptomyces sp. NPDC058471]|uniref:hypothetical protein n=1 Tax=Streptomyces sp. NPDC058471 TaxID=3346516 RepID=UPI003650E8A1
MPHTTVTPTADAPDLFTTRQGLDRELTATGTWKALHAAVRASNPSWTGQPRHH